MPTSKRPGRAELLPRYLYFSSLLKGRKVLEVGAVAATEGLSAHHLAKLCKEVVAVDDAPEDVAKAQRRLAREGLTYQAGGLSKLKAKSFDVVLASEVNDENAAEDLTQYVSRKGFLIVGVRVPAGPSFRGKAGPGPARLHEKVQAIFAEKFEAVTVLWQSAVVGYEISPDGNSELTLDPSLAGETEPGYQLIIAGAKLPELAGGTVFSVSQEDVELGADQATFKALEQELHRVRIELVEKQADFHSSAGQPPSLQVTSATQIIRPSAEQDRVLNAAHAQLTRAVEELKAVRESEARLRESVGQEVAQKSELRKQLDEARSSDAAARAELRRLSEQTRDADITGKFELKKQLEAHDSEVAKRSALEQALSTATAELTRQRKAAADQSAELERLRKATAETTAEVERQRRAVAEANAELERQREASAEAQVAASAELKRLMDEATKAEVDAEAQLHAQLRAAQDDAATERRAWEAKLVEADAKAARLTAAGQELSKKRADLEAQLAATKKRLGELEEELALATSMESNALAEARAQVMELRENVDRVGVALTEAGAREEKLREAVEAQRVERAAIDRDFTSVMRELRQALDEKEALEKQLANEALERARVDRMRKA